MLDEAGSDVIEMKKLKITDLEFDKNNANRGTERGKRLLADSLSQLGAGRSILSDKNGVVIAGNKTLLEAQKLGLEIEVVQTSGDKLVCVQRTDLDLYKDSRARTLATSDNRIAELDLDWDVEQLLQNLDNITIDGLWTDAELNRLQDNLDLTRFEAFAADNETDDLGESRDAEDKSSSNKTEANMVPFHSLLSQGQRQRLFDAIVVAKNQHGLETTAEALDVIAQEYLNDH